MCNWLSEMLNLFNKFNIIEFSVYSAPPRPFICLLSLLSCGSVISVTCLRTRTVPDRTPAIGTHRGGSDALPELVVSEDYLVVFELYRLSLITLWIDSNTDPSSQKKQNHVWLILRFYIWEAGLLCGEEDVQTCRDKTSLSTINITDKSG